MPTVAPSPTRMSTAVPPSLAAPLKEAARAAQEPLGAPVALAWPKPRPSALLRLAAFLAALAAHAAILLSLTREPLDLRAGGEGRLMASVNVTMIDTKVLQARKANLEQPPAPPAAKGMVDVNDGVPDGKKAPQAAEDKEPQEKKAAHVQSPDTQATAATQEIDKPQQMPEQKRAKASNAKPLGGFTSRADAATTAEQAAPAATSPGVMRAYAAAVAEALDRTKPKRVPGYGTLKVEVKLVISINGEIASLEVLRSSGNRRADDTVLAAVRRTKLPVPPPGLSLKERWFEFEYTFDPKRL